MLNRRFFFFFFLPTYQTQSRLSLTRSTAKYSINNHNATRYIQYIYIVALHENHFLIEAIFSISNDIIHVAYRAVMRQLAIENTSDAAD